MPSQVQPQAVPDSSQPSSQGPEPQKKRIYLNKRALVLYYGLGLLLAFALGYVAAQLRGNVIDRKAVIYSFEGARIPAWWAKLALGKLSFFPEKTQGRQAKKQSIDLDLVRRIDLYPPKKKEEPAKTVYVLSDDEKAFLGRYRLKTNSYRGLLYIYRNRKGRLSASLRFTNWGKQVMEFLRRVRVRGRRISFLRSCSAKSCARIGSGRNLRQEFYGLLSKDRRKITGKYTGGQSGSFWEATRY